MEQSTSTGNNNTDPQKHQQSKGEENSNLASTEDTITQGIDGQTQENEKIESATKDHGEQQSFQIEEEKEEDTPSKEITLSQYLELQEKEEKLQNQLMCHKLTDKCRYDEGYIYQQVFACLTCYDEQIKNLPEEQQQALKGKVNNGELENYIKPHGFCLGCMIHCHENHEIVELYHKLDFRCDCGNGRMPYSCQLNNDKEYLNDNNQYNHTYFDCYCYCKKPHSYEEIQSFMIECYECEDWFHNHHLTPTIQEQQLSDQYILICKNCVKDKFLPKIAKYSSFMHSNIKEYLADSSCLETPAKRQKLDNNKDQQAKNYYKANCQEEEKATIKIDEPFDIIVDEEFINYICNCQECQQIFKKIKRHVEATQNMSEEEKKLQNNLEGNLNEEEEEKESPHMSLRGTNIPLSSQQTRDYFFNKMVESFKQTAQKSNMSHESQIYFAENFRRFTDKLTEFLLSFDDKKKVLCEQDVQQFFRELNLERQKSLQEHLDIKRHHD